jgi:hypothetical protein
VTAAKTLPEAILGTAGRATLPFREAERSNFGTAFWYNHLVEDTPEHEVVAQYLITADALTAVDIAAFTMRPELGDPAPSADQVMLTDNRKAWTRLPGLGVAVMPAATLHAYADRKGWRWTTDEITDGVAARDRDLATIGRKPVEAYILGHDVGENGARLQGLVPGAVLLDGNGRLRWNTGMPLGCVGAPVFATIPFDNQKSRMVCLGAVLPGAGHNEIAPFDRIRKAVAALAAPPRRRWWNRRQD